MKKNYVVWCGLASAALLFAFACNNTSNDQPATAGSDRPFSDWSIGCDSQQGGSKQQQQQVSYKQSQQQNCSKQTAVQFPEQGISDFHFDVDCDSRKMNVTQLGDVTSGHAFRTESFPIQADDTWKGQMSYQQQLPNDGKGKQSCWVEYVIVFNGKCNCEPKDDGGWKKTVDVHSTVELAQADPSVFGHPSPVPSPDPSASPSPAPSETPSPSPEPSASPSPSPSPSPSASPTPRPSATIIPIVVCTVDNDACPWEGDGHMGCE